MELEKVNLRFNDTQKVKSTIEKLETRPSKIQWKNVIGASKVFHAIAVAREVPGHHLFILQDKEEAAYFLNDLQNLNPDNERITFYPASYKVPYQLEEVDNANVVERAEALEKISKNPNTWVVTYPKALFERVPTKQRLETNSFKIQKGEEYQIEFLNEFLLEHGFHIVDFVYEPGQFAIRGGIVDIYSYSNDLPFRLEFFGDEIETIRTFDPVTQLSIKEHVFFHIVPNITLSLDHTENGSFLSFVGSNTTIWVSSLKEINGQLDTEYKKATSIYTALPDTGVKHSQPSELYFHPTEWEKQIQVFSQIEWGPDYTNKEALLIQFSDKPQPTFNKNFDLLTEDLKQRKKLG